MLHTYYPTSIYSNTHPQIEWVCDARARSASVILRDEGVDSSEAQRLAAAHATLLRVGLPYLLGVAASFPRYPEIDRRFDRIVSSLPGYTLRRPFPRK